MNQEEFDAKLATLNNRYETLINRPNQRMEEESGLFDRYRHPVLTAEHVPLFWKFDFDSRSNPYLLQRIGVNGVFNAGAMKYQGKYLVAARIEGYDRKSFLAIAESPNGVDQFRFWDNPITMPETHNPDTNVYDIRLIRHEDGWIYGLFCTERKDPDAPSGDTSAAVAQCGIARTRDLKSWERLKDLRTGSGQQRNVVLHPEFVNGKYALYTRPQDSFIYPGSGGGIGFGLTDSMEEAVVNEERIIDNKVYHTIKEIKNGLGPAPIKTDHGWLHLAHGVRGTAAGLRYVLYLFMTSLENPAEMIHSPGGYFMAPKGSERVGDVSNVLFSNGWIKDSDGKVFIYYASSDTRLHVAVSHLDRLVDYCRNTPADGLRSAESVKSINQLIEKNLKLRKLK